MIVGIESKMMFNSCFACVVVCALFWSSSWAFLVWVKSYMMPSMFLSLPFSYWGLRLNMTCIWWPSLVFILYSVVFAIIAPVRICLALFCRLILLGCSSRSYRLRVWSSFMVYPMILAACLLILFMWSWLFWNSKRTIGAIFFRASNKLWLLVCLILFFIKASSMLLL